VFDKGSAQFKFDMIRGSYSKMVGRVTKPEYAQQGIAAIKDFGLKYKKFGLGPAITGALKDIKAERVKLNDTASATAADDAIKAVNDTN
jgi:aminopeptidase N